MDALGFLKAFLEITGPWSFAGVILFLWWDAQRQNRKSINEVMLVQTEVLKALSSKIESLCTSLQEHDKNLEEAIKQVAINREIMTLVQATLQKLQPFLVKEQETRKLGVRGRASEDAGSGSKVE